MIEVHFYLELSILKKKFLIKIKIKKKIDLSRMSNYLLADLVFEVNNIEKKYFTRVSRLECKNIEGNIDLLLDINTEIFPMKKEDKFSLSISKSLTSTGDEGVYDQGDEKNMELDKFHYVMYGKIFRYEEEQKQL